MPTFTCVRTIGNLWSNYLGVNILSLDWSVFKRPEPSNFIKNILLSKPSGSISLPSKNLYKFLKAIYFSCFFLLSCGLVLYSKLLMLLDKLSWSSLASSKVVFPS